MLKLHKDFHTFSTPGQIISNECCPQFGIPEQSEIINKFENVETTQGFSYIFQTTLNRFCVHGRIHEHAEISDLVENLDISLDKCKKTIS